MVDLDGGKARITCRASTVSSPQARYDWLVQLVKGRYLEGV